MNVRLIVGCLIVLSLAALGIVARQRHAANPPTQLATAPDSSSPPAANPPNAGAESSPGATVPPAELPQPRDEERLHSQVATESSRNPDETSLPPGFVRLKDARWSGTSTPDDTFQSSLWALHHHKLDALFALMETNSAARLKEDIGDSPEEFFRKVSAIPAMRLANQKVFGAATIKAELELGPDDPENRTIFFFQYDGQWKLVLENPEARFTR